MRTARKRMLDPGNKNEIAILYRQTEAVLAPWRRWMYGLGVLEGVAFVTFMVFGPRIQSEPFRIVAVIGVFVLMLPAAIVAVISYSSLTRSAAMVRAYKAQPNWKDIWP